MAPYTVVTMDRRKEGTGPWRRWWQWEGTGRGGGGDDGGMEARRRDAGVAAVADLLD